MADDSDPGWLRLTVRAGDGERDVAVRRSAVRDARPAADDDIRREIRRALDLPSAAALAGPIHDAAVLGPESTDHAEIALIVETGPDCGRLIPLSGRRITVGRARDNTVVLADSSVSRHQLTVEYGTSGVHVSSIAQTNPLRVDGEPIEPPFSLSIGHRLTIGHTGIRVIALGAPEPVPPGPAPSQAAGPAPDGLDVPEPPDAPRPRSLSIATIVVPVIVAAVLVAVTHSWFYLTFCAFGPLTALTSYFSDKRAGKRRSRADRRSYRVAKHRFDTALRAALDAEAAALEKLYPPVGRPRSPGFRARIGTATMPAAVELRGRNCPTPVLDNVPVGLAVLAPERASPTGSGTAAADDTSRSTVALGGAEAGALARSITAQLCAGNSPADLRLMLSDPDDESWAWTRWLPHRGRAADAARTTLIIDNAADSRAIAAAGRVITLAASPNAADAAVVCRGDGVAAAGPAWTGTRPLGDIVLDLISASTADRWARQIAQSPSMARPGSNADYSSDGRRGNARPGSNAAPGSGDRRAPGTSSRNAAVPEAPCTTADSGVPSQVDLGRLVPLSGEDLAARWAERAPTTSAVIGKDAAGPLAIDLARDGPHLMIAGTTGAGKSELLQTLIFSLAAVNDPRDLQFVLFDFKGGSGLRQCAALPHAAGSVTDLDEHLAARAFTSLQAELRRRERLFADAGVADFDEFRGSGDSSAPRLVIVIDEFRVLAEEQPDLLAAIVRTVCVGRSLGVHLVLATQRPAGIVSAEMQANINARISLRVRDAADSREVIDSPDAARLSSAMPGRAFLRTGGDPLIEFQTAKTSIGAGDPAPTRRDTRLVRLLTASDPLWQHTDRGPVIDTPDAAGRADLDAFARAARGLRTAGSPWLPPLPAVVAVQDLSAAQPPVADGPPAADGPAAASGPAADGLPAAAGPAAASVPMGLADDPATASRRVLSWSPGVDGNVMLIGTTRSGRSQTVGLALRALAGRVGASLYILDAANQHAAIDTAPCVGARATPAEPDRAARVIERLQRELSDRTFRPGPHRPLVLVIDGWESWAPVLDGAGTGAAIDGVTSISRSGPGVGVFVLIAGDRPLAMSRLGTTISNKILLRQSDDADLSLLGVARSAIPSYMPPGRGLAFGSFSGRRVEALEVQLAYIGAGEPARTGSDCPVDEVPAGDRSEAAPFVVRRLPPEVGIAAVGRPTPERITVGLGGDEAAPLGWGTDRHFLIAGPPGSGRSTAVAVIAEQCRRAGLPVFRPQSGAAPRHVLESLAAALDERPPAGRRAGIGPVALIDDLDTLGPECERDLADLVGDGGLTVAAAGSTDRLVSAFSGLAGMLKASRHGVLLCPVRPMDGEVFGVRLAASTASAPGRGLFFDAARPTPFVLARC